MKRSRQEMLVQEIRSAEPAWFCGKQRKMMDP